jgi:hypothetical protein
MMRIVTPAELEQVAWEGELEPLAETFKGPGGKARVAIGEPVWWPASRAMESQTGKKWSPPAGDRRYTLVRLACTLYPASEPRTHFAQATLTAFLRPGHGSQPVLAHDLYPQRLTAESKGKFTVGLKPELKFAQAIDAKLIELGAEIEYVQAFPVIQGYGLGESRPYWQFARHAANPLLGCQSVYVVLSAPQDAGGVRVSVELIAKLETRWGPVHLALPEDAKANLSRAVQ